MLYHSAGVMDVILHVLQDTNLNLGHDMLMEHSIRYNCLCVLWNLSRTPQLRLPLLQAGVPSRMISLINQEQQDQVTAQQQVDIFDCDNHNGAAFFAGLTAANLVGKRMWWSPKGHTHCSELIQQKVLVVKMAANRASGNLFAHVPTGLVDHILGNLEDGWDVEAHASQQLLGLGFPVVRVLMLGMETGRLVAGACWHLSKHQSALDGLARTISCLASDQAWRSEMLEGEHCLRVLFRLTDPVLYNSETQHEACAALLSLLSEAPTEPSTSTKHFQTIEQLMKCQQALLQLSAHYEQSTCNRVKAGLKKLAGRIHLIFGTLHKSKQTPDMRNAHRLFVHSLRNHNLIVSQ
eukprot:TRINITY_DN8488_c0_g1_i7.p1 TRINITY_DN8488_c0_g1~~TRINITY_DN8488_c0_g1_i7.p1  ORF type:complete len:350 (+),score=44.66 TRINITY_DN8488_c0_g1_i7:386-1435(+)